MIRFFLSAGPILLSFFLLGLFSPNSAVAFQNSGANLKVSDPWSFRAFYHELRLVKASGELPLEKVERNDGLFGALYVPPLNILSWIYFKTIGRDSDDVAKAVLSKCPSAAGLDKQIFCMSNNVAAYVEKLPSEKSGVMFDWRTYCAVAANVFANSFNRLKIPRSHADFVDGSWRFPSALHVVNVVYLTTPDGRVFSYVVDNGNLPGVLFPLSEAAIRFHTGDPRGVKTKDPRFPKIDFYHPGSMTFRPKEN